MVVTATADPNSPDEEFEGLETRAIEVLGQFSLDTDDQPTTLIGSPSCSKEGNGLVRDIPLVLIWRRILMAGFPNSFLPNNLSYKEPLGVLPPVLVLPVLLLLHHLLHSLRKAEPSWT